jgi:hypothetical protein
MSKVGAYRSVLRSLDDWDGFLLAESGLPGPRGNLELAEAAATEGDAKRLRRYAVIDATAAPANSPQEFLTFCGVLGLGRLLAEGDRSLLIDLRRHANDPRWRTREATAMALQRWGERDMEALLAEMARWASGSLLERRAAAAALCEPRLLRQEAHVIAVLAVLHAITNSLLCEQNRRSAAFRTLRQCLGYCWSVAVAAAPDAGKPAMAHWFSVRDADVRWIMRENLRKARLARMDAAWVQAASAQLAGEA